MVLWKEEEKVMQCPYETKTFECNPRCKVWDEERKGCEYQLAHKEAEERNGEEAIERRIMSRGW